MHEIAIYNDSQTITFADGTISASEVLEYVPASPDTIPQDSLGGELPLEEQTVTDTIELLIKADTEANVSERIQLIRSMLRRAQKRPETTYMRLRLSSDSQDWDAEIVSGRLELAPDTLRYWGGKKIEARLMITRKEFVGEEAEVSISNSAQVAPKVGGISIWNGATANQPNWFDVSGSVVEGDQPAHSRVQITNASGTPLLWRNFYMANNVFNRPRHFDPFLLGSESAITHTNPASWPAGADHNQLEWAWELDGTQIGAADGDNFRLIACFNSISSVEPLYLQAHVGVVIGGIFSVFASTPREVYARNHRIIDLGSIPIPAKRNTANRNVGVMMSVRSQGSGSANLRFLSMLPSKTSRRINQYQFSALEGESVTDDSYHKSAYASIYGSAEPIVRTYGKPLMLEPGEDQRISVLFGETNNAYNAARRSTVRLFMRPRRWTV